MLGSSSSADEDKKGRGKKIYSSEGMFLGYENDFKKNEPTQEEKDRIEAERRNNNAALAAGAPGRLPPDACPLPPAHCRLPSALVLLAGWVPAFKSRWSPCRGLAWWPLALAVGVALPGAGSKQHRG